MADAKDTPPQADADVNLEASKPRTSFKLNDRTQTPVSHSPASRLTYLDGELNVGSRMRSASVFVPDMMNLFALTWSGCLRVYASRITEIKDMPFTSFEQIAILQMLLILVWSHFESFSPNSTRRADLMAIYKPLIRRMGKLILLKDEVTFLEAIFPIIISTVESSLFHLSTVAPDTPGIDAANDNTGYTSDGTAIFYLLPFKVIFDWFVTNARSNNNQLQNLANIPARFVTNFAPRSGAPEGLNRAQSSSAAADLDAAYVVHQAVPGIVDTWANQLFGQGIDCTNFLASTVHNRNRLISDSNVPHSGKTIEDLFGKGYSIETLTSNLSAVYVVRPSDWVVPAPAGANHPDRSDMSAYFLGSSSLLTDSEDSSYAALFSLNPYFGRISSANFNIGSVRDAPDQGGPDGRRDVNTYALRPIPAWAGPIMIGPIFDRPLVSASFSYDRTIIGRGDELH